MFFLVLVFGACGRVCALGCKTIVVFLCFFLCSSLCFFLCWFLEVVVGFVLWVAKQLWCSCAFFCALVCAFFYLKYKRLLPRAAVEHSSLCFFLCWFLEFVVGFVLWVAKQLWCSCAFFCALVCAFACAGFWSLWSGLCSGLQNSCGVLVLFFVL